MSMKYFIGLAALITALVLWTGGCRQIEDSKPEVSGPVLELVLAVDTGAEDSNEPGRIETLISHTRAVLEARVRGMDGITADFQDGPETGRLLVRLEGVHDAQRVKRVLSLPGRLEFRPVPESAPFAVSRDEIIDYYRGTVPDDVELLPLTISGGPGPEIAAVSKSAILTSNNVHSARVAPDSYRQSMVEIDLDSAGARIMSEFSEQNIGRHLAIVLDGRVLAAPVIQDRIEGKFSISGLKNLEEAEELVVCLNAGSLPAPVSILSERVHVPDMEMN